jgi:hypothetical protein
MSLRLRPYTWAWALTLSLAALALPACGSSSAQRPPVLATATNNQSGTSKAAPEIERDAQSAVSAVLAQYLNLSIARRHEAAYALLSDKDHRARAWITYVNAEREADRLRDQVGSLGQPKFKITWLKVGAGMATGIVRLTTGIGTSKLRFILLREADSWKIDYENSWQPVADA